MRVTGHVPRRLKCILILLRFCCAALAWPLDQDFGMNKVDVRKFRRAVSAAVSAHARGVAQVISCGAPGYLKWWDARVTAKQAWCAIVRLER